MQLTSNHTSDNEEGCNFMQIAVKHGKSICHDTWAWRQKKQSSTL